MADSNNPTINGLKPSDFYVEVANTGLKVFGGYLTEEFDPQLRGLKGARQLREMQDTDPIIGAIIFAISQAIRKIDWHLQPADQSVPALMAQEFFESVMIDMDHTWDDFISEVMSMMTFGYAPFEIVLKERKGDVDNLKQKSRFDDGMIGVRKLGLRGQDTILRWIMDADNNDVLGMVQMPWNGGIRTIPIEKLMIFRTLSAKNNPQGRSLLRNAYRPYYFKKRIEETEAIGIERDLAGLPVMKVPAELLAAANSGADPDAAATLTTYKNLVVNIKRNTQEGIVLPSNRDEHGNLLFELSLLNTGGQRQFDTSTVIERYNQQIATTVMADFLLLGHSRGAGSANVGSNKIEMFYSAIESFIQSIAGTLNTVLVPLLAKLNGIPEKLWPQFYADKAEQIDLGKLGAYINALAASGMQLFPDHDLEAYLRGVAGLPDVSDEVQQANDLVSNTERAAAVKTNIEQLHAPPPWEQQAPGPGGGGKPPAKAGAGGGAPSKPQGSFGGPRQLTKRIDWSAFRIAA